jgi:1,2-phenylacetyl-CoA epoxidase PaaB subunit
MPETLYVWRVFRTRTGPAKLVATVRAPDAKSAVMVAAAKLRLRRPEGVKRLVAFRLEPEIEPAGWPSGSSQ